MSQPPAYGPPPYPPPPYGPPSVPAKRKSKAPMILGIIGAVLLVMCGGLVACIAIVSSGGDNTGTGGDKAAGAVGLNQAARDGKFEFTVTKVQCGLASVGTDLFGKKAQGQFCKVHITVQNIGDKPQTFDDSNQHAYNAAGQRYDADGAAALYLGEEAKSFLEDINPGNTVNGIVLFDIPKNSKIVKLELHDSAFSGGVTVNV